jgi:hypothetical protein
LGAALDKYEKALTVIIDKAPDQFIPDEPVYTTNEEKLFHVGKFLTNPRLSDILGPSPELFHLHRPMSKLQKNC